MSSAEMRRIQNAVVAGDYDLTVHAVEELAEDDLDVNDLEAAVASGEIISSTSDDLRGTRYTLAGPSVDGTSRVGIVGRITSTGVFLVITAFAVSQDEG